MILERVWKGGVMLKGGIKLSPKLGWVALEEIEHGVMKATHELILGLMDMDKVCNLCLLKSFVRYGALSKCFLGLLEIAL